MAYFILLCLSVSVSVSAVYPAMVLSMSPSFPTCSALASLCCPPLGSGCPSFLFSWLAHLCFSTADPGSPSAAAAAATAAAAAAAAAAVGCFWWPWVRSPSLAVGDQNLGSRLPGPKGYGPVRPR